MHCFALVLLSSLAVARLILHKTGNSELTTFANLSLPNTTVIATQSGELLNVLAELQALRSQVAALQAQLSNVSTFVPACQWEGVSCHCFFNGAVGTDIVVTIGTMCQQGRLLWTRVISAVVATAIGGCGAVNTTSQCNFTN